MRRSRTARCPGSRPGMPPGRWWPLIVPVSLHPQGSEARKQFVVGNQLRWPPGGRLPLAIPTALHSQPAAADLRGRHRCALLAPAISLHPISMLTAASRTRRSSARWRALTWPAFPLRSPVTMLAVSPWVSPLGRLKSSLLAPALATTNGRSRPPPLCAVVFPLPLAHDVALRALLRSARARPKNRRALRSGCAARTWLCLGGRYFAPLGTGRKELARALLRLRRPHSVVAARALLRSAWCPHTMCLGGHCFVPLGAGQKELACTFAPLRRPHLVVALRALLRSARHGPERAGPCHCSDYAARIWLWLCGHCSAPLGTGRKELARAIAPTTPPASGCGCAGVTSLHSARAGKSWPAPCSGFVARTQLWLRGHYSAPLGTSRKELTRALLRLRRPPQQRYG